MMLNNTKIKVLFLDTVHPILEDQLLNMGFKCEHDYKSDRRTILKKIHNYEGLIIRSRIKIDKEFLAAASKLKFIGRSGAGLENIDCKEAENKGIHLFSAPEGNRQAVGEHAVGMILSLFNKISIADKEIRSGKWNREANRGIELSGKTIGIIGYGNTGKAFAKCLSGFNCKVLAYDKYKKNFSDECVQESSLENIQNKSDIISFHTPYNEDTHHYLNESFIKKMNKPFFIINTARGKVINTSDLIKGLKSKKIQGACLDVLEYEKASFENTFSEKIDEKFQYLLSCKNILFSPHVAGWTYESYEKLSTVLADKIECYYNSNKHLST